MQNVERSGPPASSNGSSTLWWVTLAAFLVTGAVLLGWDFLEHAYLSQTPASSIHGLHMLRGITTGVLVSVGISWILVRNRRRYEQNMLELQKQLIQKERLAAIGELAGGVAHEIRNPLAGIDGALTMLAREIPADDESQETMSEIQRQIRRMERLVSDLLTYARPEHLHPERTDVHAILKQAVESIRILPNIPRAEAVLDFDRHLPNVFADPRELEHAFENLILNACQAIDEGGKVEVRTKVVDDTVNISISDCGAGIDPEVLPRIFEPFFTTKARGTGLGLPLVSRAIENNGGEVTVRSAPGVGTTFEIYLPPHPETAETDAHGPGNAGQV